MKRVLAVDVFRGAVMFFMLLKQMGLKEVSERNSIAGFFFNQLSHAPWFGFHFEDVILPWFLIIIGLSMAISDKNRKDAGEAGRKRLGHALRRAGALFGLGYLLTWLQHGAPFWGPGVLQLLALAYLGGYLFLGWERKKQWAAFAGLLFVFWFFVFTVPVPGVGRNSYELKRNIVYWIDTFIYPDPSVWGYLYTSITASACVVFGCMIGKTLMARTSDAAFIKTLILYGLCGVGAALLLNPFVPVIKRMFTPTYVLLTCGIVSLLFAACFWLVEVKGIRKGWSLFLILGANSIFVYVLDGLLRVWMMETGKILLSPVSSRAGLWMEPLQHSFAVALECLVCLWLYRRKLFFKL